AMCLHRARAGLPAQRWADAVSSLESAVKLAPDDQEAQKLLDQARQSAASARMDYTRFMTQADTAFRLGRYEEAFRNYTDALRAVPNDPAAQAGLQKLQRLSEDAQAG